MRGTKESRTLLGSAGVAVLAIGCCAGLPVLAGAFGGLALATVIGVGAGLVALITIPAGVLIMRERRRRSCTRTARAPKS
jgi:hypothetical protein